MDLKHHDSPLCRLSRALAGRSRTLGVEGLQLSSGWYSRSLSPACTHAFLQLTETSSRYARKISGTTALQEALKEKQQHIEQLLAERDLERAEVAKATSHICEVEKEIALLKAQHEQVAGLAGRWGHPEGASSLPGPVLGITLMQREPGVCRGYEDPSSS